MHRLNLSFMVRQHSFLHYAPPSIGDNRRYQSLTAGRPFSMSSMAMPPQQRQLDGDLSTVETMAAITDRVVHVPKIKIAGFCSGQRSLRPLHSYLSFSDARRTIRMPALDGQPPTWSGQRRGNSCEYFHYSIVEKKA